MSRIKSSCFLINLQIGIGVLALPNTLHAIGMIPGIICILASGLITTYLDTVIGTFKRGHPEVYSIADTGYVMFGRFGKELFGGMYWVRFHHQSRFPGTDGRYSAYLWELVRSWHSRPQ
jgi:amino acid permease